MRVLLVSANREKLPSPVVPLGVLAVAGALRREQAGRPTHEVHVVDLCFEDDPGSALARAIAETRPDLVGLGLRNLHTNAYAGSEALVAEYAQVAQTIRASTKAPLVLGGSAFSLRPALLLDRLGADHGVVGEGERALRDLVDDLSAGRRPPRLVSSPLRWQGGSNDMGWFAPAARDLVDPRYYAYDGSENVQTKRGCAFHCAYCDYPDLEGRTIRTRDPDSVADEIKERASVPGVSHVFFVDSVFNVPRWHALAISQALVRRGSPLPWLCYATPASLDDELVAKMAEAGCVGVELGTDTGTEAMLERLRKPFKLDDVRAARARLARHGIRDAHTFVLGAEGETADEVMATLRFVDELDPDVAVFMVFMEDREAMTPGLAQHREEILALLAEEAPKRPGWVVPELSIRFGEKLASVARRAGWRGPAWLRLAGSRRASSGKIREGLQ